VTRVRCEVVRHADAWQFHFQRSYLGRSANALWLGLCQGSSKRSEVAVCDEPNVGEGAGSLEWRCAPRHRQSALNRAPRRQAMFERILLATDGSDTSFQALLEAMKLAKDQNARLRLVYVVDLESLYPEALSGWHDAAIRKAARQGGQELLDRAAALLRSEGIPVDTVLRSTTRHHVSRPILDEAKRWKADLIVLGTHGRHGVERLFFGSVAEGVARAASVPVLLVRGTV